MLVDDRSNLIITGSCPDRPQHSSSKGTFRVFDVRNPSTALNPTEEEWTQVLRPQTASQSQLQKKRGHSRAQQIRGPYPQAFCHAPKPEPSAAPAPVRPIVTRANTHIPAGSVSLCRFFNTLQGCRKGATCRFIHS